MKYKVKAMGLLLVAVLSASLLVGCSSGGGEVAAGNDFTSADVLDGGATQQRWLKHPESKLVINPNAIGADSYTADSKNAALNLGITDDTGSVTATLNDVVFFVENNRANGTGYELVYEPSFVEGDANAVKNLAKLETNTSNANHFIGSTTGNVANLGINDTITFNGSDANAKDIYAIIKVNECTNTTGIDGYFQSTIKYSNPNGSCTIAKITEPGLYVINLCDAIREREGAEITTDCSITLQMVLQKNTSADFTLAFGTFNEGYSIATEDATHSWAPYEIDSKVLYKNGTSLSIQDVIMGESVSRAIIASTAGQIGIAGKIYGTPSYDARENILTFAADGYTYSVAPKRKSTILYYATLDDLMSNTNGSAEYSGQAYWLLDASVKAGETFNVGVAASATLSADEIEKLADTATGTHKVSLYLANQVEYWDNYIAGNSVTDYIAKIPEAK